MVTGEMSYCDTMKMYRVMEVKLHAVDIGLERGEWSTVCLWGFAPGIHGIGGWVASELEIGVKRVGHCSYQELNI